MSSATKKLRYVNGKPVWTADAPQAAAGSSVLLGGVSAYTASQPWVSKSVGVNPREQKEVNEKLREYGVVGAEINSKGFLQATSREGRKKALEFFGYADRDASFGDVNKHDLNGLREYKEHGDD